MQFNVFPSLSMQPESNQKLTLPILNLPQYQPQLHHKDGKDWIFDPLRKKQLVLTPEEWVRQHWINFLIHHHDYPKGLFSLEKGMIYNKLRKRTDLVVFDQDCQPFLLIECKAPNVSIDEKTLSQIMTYNTQLNSPNLVLSNGLKHIFLAYSEPERKFVQRNSLPTIFK